MGTNSGVCCKSHTKHIFWFIYSYETKIFVFLLVLGDSRKDTNAGVCCESHKKHKYWCLMGQSYETQILIFVLRVIGNRNIGVCCESHTKHKLWYIYSCETQIFVFLLVLGDSRKDTNTGVCYDSHMQHKYKCSKIERLLILVQLVYQWPTNGPNNPRGAWGP